MARNRFLTAYLLGATFLPQALYASDLPTDPTVISGDVTVGSPSGGQLVVSQTSGFGVVDWGSFSIGQGLGVQFNNGSGATLNRVTGTDVSSIMGNLNATGSVFLINPNGIIVGKTGVVNTGGRFVATTLDVSNQDFLDGGDTTFAGPSAAYVVNLGKVSSMGGDVALLARNVVNEGTLSAPNGTVGVVAGREILMRDASVDDGLFAVKVGGADTSVSEAGSIKAAAAELRAKGGNVYALAGNTSGTIEATGVAKVAGRVFLTSDGGAVKANKTVKAKNADGTGGKIVAHAKTIDLGGQLDASGTRGGTVEVKGTEDTQFHGEIYATGDTTSDGGFVEVSGGHLSFAGDVQTDGGTLLIDPNNLEISDNNSVLLSGASLLLTSDITGQLATQNVIIETTGADGEAGTIAVTSAVEWNSNFSLTLLAQGDIRFNASVQNSSEAGGDVNAVAGWDGTTGRTGFVASVFDAATLASQTLFGAATAQSYTLNAVTFSTSGSVFVGDGGNFSATAVGAKGGATRVYGNDLVVQGSTTDATDAYAQLGFNVSSVGDAGTIAGNIAVRATGDVSVIGGARSGDAAQIGHVGLNTFRSPTAATTVAASGAISIESLGDVLVQANLGAASNESYALIGNGDLSPTAPTAGDRSGDITVKAGGEMSIDPGAIGVIDGVRIGHFTAGGTIANNITLTAAAFDQSAGSAVGSGGMGALDISMLVRNTRFGDVRLTTTDSALTLSGSTKLITCECSFISAPGDFIVQTSGDLALAPAFVFGNQESTPGAGDAGGALVLASGGNLINNAGAAAIGPMTGPWALYSNRPDNDTGTLGVLSPDEVQFGRTFDPLDPLDVAQLTGNALIYRQAPLIVVSDATIVYGDALPVVPVTMFVNGTTEVITDPSTWGVTIDTPVIDGTRVTFSADNFVNVGTYASALKTTEFNASELALNGIVNGSGALTVTPATITFGLDDQTKTYDSFAYSGVESIGFDSKFTTLDPSAIFASVVLAFDGGDGSGTNVGTYTVSVASVTEASGNFIFDTTDTGRLDITPATVTVSLGDQTRTFDGVGGYTGVVTFTGFVGGDQALITGGPTFGITGGDGSGRNVGAYTVSASGTTESSGNYVFNQSDTAQLVIDPATVTVTLGDQTRTFDGVGGYAGAVSFTGFVGGDTAALITGGPTFGITGGDGSGRNAGTYTVSASGTTESSGNYVFNQSDTAQLVIDRKVLTADIIGLPSKANDGTNQAVLTPDNFLLNGLVAGESMTITQTLGTFDSAANGTRSVTATLAGSDFVAGAGTGTANYVLPTSATGPGQIVALPPTVVNIPAPTLVDFPTTPLGDPTGPADRLQTIDTETTRQILEQINAGANFCREFVQQEYAIDCLSDRLQATADGLSATGEYSEVKAALQDAARKLHAIAISNQSSTLGQVVARSTSGPQRSSSRPLVAVSKAALASANAEATAIIVNTQLVLLRSAANSERRRVAFQQVGQILGTTKVLLRSS